MTHKQWQRACDDLRNIHWAQCPGLPRKLALLLGCWAMAIALVWCFHE
jgi:uncharacterized iron-regulated membrane protein